MLIEVKNINKAIAKLTAAQRANKEALEALQGLKPATPKGNRKMTREEHFALLDKKHGFTK